MRTERESARRLHHPGRGQNLASNGSHKSLPPYREKGRGANARRETLGSLPSGHSLSLPATDGASGSERERKGATLYSNPACSDAGSLA